MAKRTSILVENLEIGLLLHEKGEYLSISDMAKNFGQPNIIIQNWMRNRNTIEFLGTWEEMHNEDFNRIEFEAFKNESGGNTFTMSPTRWAESTNAVGMTTKAGRYGGGTFAHKDIAMGFAFWAQPRFQLLVIKEFQLLKEQENKERALESGWNLRRTLSRINYRIHTDAVRSHLIPPRIQNTKMEGMYFAGEADILNVALFGLTAKQWRENMTENKGNMRENASTEQLLVLANLENLNAEFIKQGMDADDRLQRLNEIAIYQMELLTEMPAVRTLSLLE